MIQDTVEKLKPYATSIYKSLWQDALDAAFFHIINHFDFSISEDDDEDLDEKLYRYSTKVVGTILLGKYNHEIEHEISLINGMDKESICAETKTNPLSILIENEDLLVSQDIQQCVDYLVPYFIKDYRFFKTQKPDRRKYSYTELFQKFTPSVIGSAMRYLLNKYSDIMDSVYAKISNSRYRMFASDRYKKNLDSSIKYRGYVHNTVIYQALNRVKGSKYFYHFDIKGIITNILEEYYSVENEGGCFVVENVKGYISFSGAITFSKEELQKYIEYELIGTILARISHLKVVVYQEGKYMIFSSPKQDECGIICELFNTKYKIGFKKLVSKRILLEEASKDKC